MAVRWHHRLFTLALGAWLLLMGGCASQQTMPWGDGAAAPAGQAVVLMSVTLRNAYKDRYQPELASVFVQREDVVPQPAPLVFPTDARAALPASAAAAASAPAGGTWLVRLALEPGRYTLRSLAASARLALRPRKGRRCRRRRGCHSSCTAAGSVTRRSADVVM